ncbi:MAG: hypothetical protein KDD69_20255, partial [Bdellovibrionales bacterium]|nr:hypothetical protein [Bdellovibrionales bacterium]
RWSELLELMTQRPAKKRKAEPPKTGATRRREPTTLVQVTRAESPRQAEHGAPAAADEAPEFIPPLTISQFRAVITVANVAAENGMAELSRRAVRESLKGGFPIADPVLTNANTAQSRIIRSSSQEVPQDPIEIEVVKGLREILDRWQGDAYPPDDTYAVLHALVLPPNRPSEIRMYITSTSLLEAAVESLAESLVATASAADKLEELRLAVAQRENADTTKVSSAAMQALIAIRNDRTKDARELVEQLAEVLQGGLSSTDQQAVFLVALRAFENEELRPSAIPILREILREQLQGNALQQREVPIQSRLSFLVNQYLSEKGEQKAIQEYFEQAMLSRQSYYSRYSGDYGLYMQQRDVVSLAEQASQLDMPLVALDYLGRAVDFEPTRYGRLDVTRTLAGVVKATRSLAAEERYALWRKWTMPTENRQTLRLVDSTYAPTSIPEVFRE